MRRGNVRRKNLRRGAVVIFGSWALMSSLGACSDDTLGGTDAIVDPNTDGGSDGNQDDGFSVCTLGIAEINGVSAENLARLTPDFDLDDTQSGFQIDVTVSVIGAPDGKDISLTVTGSDTSPTAKAADGRALFKGVTLPENVSVAQLNPQGSECASAQATLSVQRQPTCAFLTPTDGAKLTSSDDRIAGNGTFDVQVTIQTENAASGGTVELIVGDSASQGTIAVNQSGVATFNNIILAPNSALNLSATVRVGTSSSVCNISVDVDTEGPACQISGFDPAAATTSRGDGLGSAQDADPSSDDLQTTITVTTDEKATNVILEQDGNSFGPVTPTDNKAIFPLTLVDGVPNFRATCTNTGNGNENSSLAKAIVDTNPPKAVADLACVIRCADNSCALDDPARSDNRRGIAICTFTSSDDGETSLGVESYELRYRENETITEANFADTATVAIPIAPTAGSTQTVTITGLSIPNTYSFAVKATDFLGNISPISNAAGPVEFAFKVQTISGSANTAELGSPIAVGDFNCDKITDVAVGVNKFDAGKGEVQIFFGSGSGLPATFSKRIVGTDTFLFNGEQTGGRFGFRLAALNFDGDAEGCTDLAVLASGTERVYLYLGRPIWEDRTDLGEGSGAEIYFTVPEKDIVAIAGEDLDGDGRDDLAITHHVRNVAPETAEVLIDYGEENVTQMAGGISPQVRALPAAAELIVRGGNPRQSFALPMVRGGRINGDEFGDLLLSGQAEDADPSAANSVKGAAYIFLGAARSSSAGQEVIDIASSTRIVRIAGSTFGGRFGRTLAGLGDVDGDGSSEFAVGEPFPATTTQGKVYIFSFNEETAPSSIADAKMVLVNDINNANTYDDQFGRALGNGASVDPIKGADLNGDGYADILVSMFRTAPGTAREGSAYVFLGGPNLPAERKVSEANFTFTSPPNISGTFSQNSVFMTDVNGDGIPDVVLSDHRDGPGDRGRFLVYF